MNNKNPTATDAPLNRNTIICVFVLGQHPIPSHLTLLGYSAISYFSIVLGNLQELLHKNAVLLNNNIMAIIFLRSTIIYVVLLVIMRLMGKRQIGEMQPIEFVVTLLIAELACIPMSDTSIPLLYGISAILAVFIIHQLMTVLEQTGAFCKFVLSGKPSIVINKNGIDFKELKKNNLDVSDLLEAMRNMGYFSFDAVEYAIFESNGTLSAIEKQTQSTPSMPIIIIKNGRPVLKNLSITKLTRQELSEYFKSLGVKSLKDVGVFTLDGNGKFYLQEFNKKYIIGQINLKEGVSW